MILLFNWRIRCIIRYLRTPVALLVLLGGERGDLVQFLLTVLHRGNWEVRVVSQGPDYADIEDVELRGSITRMEFGTTSSREQMT